LYSKRRAVQNTWTCWKCVTSAFQWNRSVSRLDPSPRQRDPLADPFQLTKVNEAAHENSRSRAMTNCEPTRAFVPLSSRPSEDRLRVTRRCSYNPYSYDFSKSREMTFWQLVTASGRVTRHSEVGRRTTARLPDHGDARTGRPVSATGADRRRVVSVGRGIFLCRVRRRAFFMNTARTEVLAACAAYVGWVTRQALMG